MNITQLSVFLENKPGRLQHVLKVLSDQAINIQTLTIAEVSDFGILRMIVNKPDEAYAALKTERDLERRAYCRRARERLRLTPQYRLC